MTAQSARNVDAQAPEKQGKNRDGVLQHLDLGLTPSDKNRRISGLEQAH
jgi:hypothetical protein